MSFLEYYKRHEGLNVFILLMHAHRQKWNLSPDMVSGLLLGSWMRQVAPSNGKATKLMCAVLSVFLTWWTRVALLVLD